MKYILLALAFLSGGCATTTKQTDSLFKNREALPVSSRLSDVPMIKQTENHCGPATMAMVLSHAGKSVSMTELDEQMFTEKMQGTFQSEMLSVARRQGMLALPISDMKTLITEISSGRPVIVFQNLGFGPWPKWHYAVVTGHDLNGPDIFLHTGQDAFKKMDMRLFERTWKLAGFWGLLVLPPDKLAVNINERTHLEAASMLERIGKLSEAQQAYQAILDRWKNSLGALIGLANVTYEKRELKKSVKYLEWAVKEHPDSAIAWHNLATVFGELGNHRRAKENSLKALSLADEILRPRFEKSLASWLNPIQ